MDTKTQFFTLFILIFQSSLCFSQNSTAIPHWQNRQLSKQASLRGSAIIGQSLWVSGSNNTVFVSQNGGKTWQDKSPKLSLALKLNSDYRDIALFDSKTAIVMGVGSGEKSVLFKTINGGDSWKMLYQNTDEQGFFDSIAFWDHNNGLLMGDPVDGYYVIKKTTDGGKTWRRISKNKLPQILNKESAFAASGNTLIVGKKNKAWLTTGGLTASVYSSFDQGESWQRNTIPLYRNSVTAGGYGLALNVKQQLFVLGGDFKQREKNYSNMVTSTNNHWFQSNSGRHGLRTAMSCLKSTCIATGKTSSDISFDHGTTWHPLENAAKAINEQGFYTLAANNNTFLAAGEKGKVGILFINN